MNAKERKKIGLPLQICAVLDLHVRAFTDKELHRFFRRLGEGGVDYVRLFPFWGEDLLPYHTQPACYRGTSLRGKFDLQVFNKEYFDELRRVCNIAYQWQVGIYYDMKDQCSLRGYYEGKQGKNPWTWNENGVNGIYEVDTFSLDFYKAWIKEVISTVGLYGYRKTRLGIKLKNKPNLFGLGNELHFKGDRKRLHNWADTWGHGLAGYMRKLGYKQQILFSGENKTAHALREFLSPWNNLASRCCSSWVKVKGRTTRYYTCGKCDNPCNVRAKTVKFGFTDSVDVWHGFHEWRPVVQRLDNELTHNRWFAVSDDGTDVKDGRHFKYPVEIEAPQGFRNAHPSVVYHTCKEIKKWLDKSPGKAKWHHIEQLPRSVSEQSQSIKQLHQDRDVNIYKRIAKRVWGVDITRKYPKWKLRRFR